MLILNGNVTFLGDSILRRYLTDILRLKSQKMYNNGNRRQATYSQLAIGGQRINQLRKRIITTKHSTCTYQINPTIILMIGTNDVLKGSNYFCMRFSLVRLLRELHQQVKKKIVLCTIPPILNGSRKQNKTIMLYNAFIKTLQGDNIQVLDVNAAVEPNMFNRTPEQCPSVVSLLAESYNPHVRYGAAMALGIACAGTGLREAIALLEPMVMFDPVNFVRQGALIASAMILIQQTEQTCSKVTFFRQSYAQVISNKHEDVMAKFGAILAQGIIDAGGRNVTLSLQSRTGHTNMLAVVGTLVFTQYWYWFPLAHCLSLAYTPTCIIALNSQLKMPKVDLKSSAKPSTYAYPAPLEEKKREEREKVTTAVLSIAARQRRRDHERKHRDEKMDVDEEEKKDEKKSEEKKTVSIVEEKKPVTLSVEDKKAVAAIAEEKKAAESKKEEKDEKKKEEKEEKKKEPEPAFEVLNNPARTLRQQLKVMTLNEGSQYVAMKDISIGGIIMVRNLKPGEEELVEPVAAFGPKGEEEKEPEAPEPFEWSED